MVRSRLTETSASWVQWVLLCCLGWSAEAQSWLIAISTSQVQGILLPHCFNLLSSWDYREKCLAIPESSTQPTLSPCCLHYLAQDSIEAFRFTVHHHQPLLFLLQVLKEHPSPSPNLWLTPVGIINVDKFLPLVMVDDADESILQFRAQLKDKLIGCINGKARRNEAHVEGPTEGETGSHSVTCAGVQWYHHGSLQLQAVEMGSHYVVQVGLELLASSDPFTSASQSAGTETLWHETLCVACNAL
ncbi:hypothetical protein AAY473_021900 [Plecturocebus cupreus]